ncbi:MAG: enoyl-CoA hydratase [Actinomycetota bacterium]|nr:enoyl-CoA hydratase [Actinomycetota bacterium]
MAVDVVTQGTVRVITINRPERRNALDPATFRGLGDAFVAAEHDDAVRVLVLTGAGDQAFCAGMDLKAFVAGDAGDAGPGPGPGTEVFVERVYPKPIIAAVNGAAVAGGFGIMLGCDLVVAAEHAVFGLPEVKRGLVGVGATSRAALRLPPAVVLELALTGAPMDAARALHHGLVNRVVPSADVLPTAIALAEEIAANAPLAVALTKEIAYDARHLLDVDIAAWRERAAPIFASADAREGATAFAEKRPPRFTGR